MVWAWERPERLEFLDPDRVGVAYLARTLALDGDRLVVRPRLQPLRVSPGTLVVAVVRIEERTFRPSGLSEDLRRTTAAAIVELGHTPGLAGVQIDFDARVSQRPFYRALLIELRERLPASVRLSINALASWCLADTWLRGLPIDDAVPMLFRMGLEDPQVRAHLASGGDFRNRACRHSVGISTDEPRPPVPAGRRVYIFSPRVWSPSTFATIRDEISRWP